MGNDETKKDVSKKLFPKKLNVHALFANFNKDYIQILGAFKTNLRSARWEVEGANLLITSKNEMHPRLRSTRPVWDFYNAKDSVQGIFGVWRATVQTIERLDNKFF